MQYSYLKQFGIIFSAVLVILTGCCLVFAKDVPIELLLERQFVEVGDVIELRLLIKNTQNVPAPILPKIEGFKSQYLGPSTKVSIVNGRSSSSITHRYRLVAIKTGVVTLGPFSFSHKGNTYTSNTRQIEVVDRGQGAQQGRAYLPQQDSESNIEGRLNGRIFVMLSAAKTKVYINERIPITVKLYVNSLSVRDIQYPLFEGQGFIKEAFGTPHQYTESLKAMLYDVVEFRTWVYPTKTGQITIGPSKIKCNIISRTKRTQSKSGFGNFFEDSFFSDFFTRLQVYSHEAVSAELLLDIMAFPEKGKPDNFKGAVGDFSMQVKAAPLDLKAGDPITLTIDISGSGNFDSVQNPVLTSAKQFKVYAPQTREEKKAKRFEQVLIPLQETIQNIPEITFSFFNPQKEKYINLKQDAIPIVVGAADYQGGKIIESNGIKGAAPTHVLGTDIVYIKEEMGRIKSKGINLYKRRIFLMLVLLPMVLLLGSVIWQRQQERLSTDVSYARKLRAPKIAKLKLKKAKEYLNKGNAEEFYEQTFKTLQEYLGHRFNRPSAGITAEVVDELLATEGLDAEVAVKLKSCFAECDIARYAAARLNDQKMKATLSILEKSIDYLERQKK